MRIAVVGVGGTGGAACRFLAQAGHAVVGYERFEIGHRRGSSHGESRIIRYTYPDALYTHLMQGAYPLWDALQQEADEELLVRCGGVFLGPPAHPVMTQTAAALEENRVPFTLLSPSEAQRRFPAMRLAGDEAALWQRDGGFLRASAIVRANARLARDHGAAIRENAIVTSIKPGVGEVIVATAAGESRAFDRVIVTAGAWLGSLFSDLGLPLTVTRQQITYLSIAENPERFARERLPVWIDAASNWYGFPSDGQIAGVKLAHHYPHTPTDPDRDPREPWETDTQAAIAYAARRFPDLAPPATHAQVCLYTNTPDEDFIFDPHPAMPDVLLVSGCSGHGFKFTVLLGKLATDWATGSPIPYDLRRFSRTRFLG